MKTTDWCAASTLAGQEYAARLELERIGLTPHLPQCRRYWLPDKVNSKLTTPLTRSFPLFPKFLLLPLAQSRTRGFHYCKALRLPRPLLDDWLASDDDVFEVMKTEHAGEYDETRTAGNLVKARGVDLFIARSTERLVELFRPLFLVVKKPLDKSQDCPHCEDPDERPAAAGCGPHGQDCSYDDQERRPEHPEPHGQHDEGQD
jgi:hypothetical protein